MLSKRAYKVLGVVYKKPQTAQYLMAKTHLDMDTMIDLMNGCLRDLVYCKNNREDSALSIISINEAGRAAHETNRRIVKYDVRFWITWAVPALLSSAALVNSILARLGL